MGMRFEIVNIVENPPVDEPVRLSLEMDEDGIPGIFAQRGNKEKVQVLWFEPDGRIGMSDDDREGLESLGFKIDDNGEVETY